MPSPVSGRLLIFLTSKKFEGQEIAPDYRDPRAVWIEAEEIDKARAGQIIDVVPQSAYPDTFSKLPSGSYSGMALLDVNHDYAYAGTSGRDLRGPVRQPGRLASGSVRTINLKLDTVIPAPQPNVRDSVEVVQFGSSSLSAFWGRPIRMNAAVVLPPSYKKSSDNRYPTMYWTHGFGADFPTIVNRSAQTFVDGMASGTLPQMIYVLLDEHCPGGTHEFADSVNNGPWGKALTEELIPYLEQRYRMDAKPSGRLLNGHSSGGWAVLWLQVAYPDFFGGTWPTSPDPSDFHSFTGPNLLANPPQNLYRKPDGSPWMLVRLEGQDRVSLEEFARQEAVEGGYGGQFASFEWVFSPRAQDGTPQQLFDRQSGTINAEVARAWEKYDIANIIHNNADRLRPLLQDKIHLTVGTWDTFHLDEPARLLEKALQDAGIRAEFTYLDGRDHFNLYQGGLMEKITEQMMHIARPQAATANSRMRSH
ncbi:MAG TPA: alpha/beta hydrolase-fold protein [Terriglobales bacterium]|nr:alpha/beta hydrolase-fold protein [Terriglobales bacterium]